MNIFQTLMEIFTNTDQAMTHFQAGNANELNALEAEKQRIFDEEQNRLAREAEERNTQSVNDTNRAIADATNQMNKAVADQNLQFQRDTLDYQKALQQQIFEREDTSYQRTALDMARAGLNPLSMQSTNGSGSVVSTSPLQNNFQATPWVAEKSNSSNFITKYERFNAVAGGVMSVLNTLNGVSDSMNNLLSGFAQRDEIQSKIESNKTKDAIDLFNIGYSPKYLDNIPYSKLFDYNSQKYLSIGDVLSDPTSFKNIEQNPKNLNFMKRFLDLYPQYDDFKRGLTPSSTEFERNIVGINRLMDNGTLSKTSDNLENLGKGLLDKLFKMWNKI